MIVGFSSCFNLRHARPTVNKIASNIIFYPDLWLAISINCIQSAFTLSRTHLYRDRNPMDEMMPAPGRLTLDCGMRRVLITAGASGISGQAISIDGNFEVIR